MLNNDKPLTLQQLRERAHLNKSGLGRLTGVHRQVIISWERGKVKPRFDHLCSLMQALECTADELFAALWQNGSPRKKEQTQAIPPTQD